MSKQKTATAGNVLYELFQFGLYKRSQGKVSRQVTCAVIWITVALGSWKLWAALSVVDWTQWFGASASRLNDLGLEYIVPGLILALGVWLGVRVVNLPRFADFLIAVEAEMNKVSWPSRGELVRSSIVVIFVIFALAAVLFGYDLLWQALFKWIGVRL